MTGCFFLEKQDAAINEVFKKELAYIQLHLAGFNIRQIEYIIDQTLKVLSTFIYIVDIFRLFTT